MITYEMMAAAHDAKEMHIHQNFYEFREWLCLLEQIGAVRGAEIGTYRFGTAQMTLEMLPRLERLVTVDVDDATMLKPGIIEMYAGRLSFVQGDSRHFATRKRMIAELPAPWDFLFIDGDHKYGACVHDFAFYSHLVRQGGLIAFHDTVAREFVARLDPNAEGIGLLWQELASRFPECTRNIITEPGSWGHYGIGVLTVPESAYFR